MTSQDKPERHSAAKRHREFDSVQDNVLGHTDDAAHDLSSLTWWNSEWGPGPLLRLAIPLMISAGFVSVTLFTDRTLLYWQSELAASAALEAGSIYWSLACFPMGLLGYVSTFVSQYRGASQEHKIKGLYRHAIFVACGFVPIFLIGMAAARLIFQSAGHSPELTAAETTYLRILLCGGLSVLFYSVQSGLLTGQGRTATVLAIDAVSTVVNLVLDAVLIFGWGPIPELGIVGAGLATSISFWLKLPIAWWVLRDEPVLQGMNWFGQKVDFATIIRFFKYGGPAGLQLVVEASCFTLILLQVGRLGELETAATTLALGINILVFVPMIGLGIGVGVLVGQHLTEGRTDLAKRSVTCAVGVTLIYTSSFAAALLMFPEKAMAIYAWGTPPERFAEIKPLLKPLLAVIAAYCILDGLQIVFVGAIKGAGDTLFVLLATLVVSTVVFGSGLYWQEAYGANVFMWWYVIAAWVLAMGFTFGGRYFSGAWTKKRVIETEFDNAPV